LGVNLVPRADKFHIVEKEFRTMDTDPFADGSVEDGCITAGLHRVLRFNTYCFNVGDTDFIIGEPKNRLDVFDKPEKLGLPKSRHEWIMKEKFYVYILSNDSGIRRIGYKRPWCLSDGENFNCTVQGIGAGKKDTYNQDLPCQFIEIGDIPDGTYTFSVIANAPSVIAARKNENFLFKEDNYSDNCISITLKIKGNDPPQVSGNVPCRDDVFSNIQL